MKVRKQNIYTTDIVKASMNKIGAEETRKIVYGLNAHCEANGMSKFINSRARDCKRKILKELKQRLN